eukprot:COSAG01_NODE_1277_length_10932_cov_18.121942_6_plen_43_part_00
MLMTLSSPQPHTQQWIHELKRERAPLDCSGLRHCRIVSSSVE